MKAATEATYTASPNLLRGILEILFFPKVLVMLVLIVPGAKASALIP